MKTFFEIIKIPSLIILILSIALISLVSSKFVIFKNEIRAGEFTNFAMAMLIPIVIALYNSSVANNKRNIKDCLIKELYKFLETLDQIIEEYKNYNYKEKPSLLQKESVRALTRKMNIQSECFLELLQGGFTKNCLKIESDFKEINRSYEKLFNDDLHIEDFICSSQFMKNIWSEHQKLRSKVFNILVRVNNLI
jgi:hypothetical protein